MTRRYRYTVVPGTLLVHCIHDLVQWECGSCRSAPTCPHGVAMWMCKPCQEDPEGYRERLRLWLETDRANPEDPETRCPTCNRTLGAGQPGPPHDFQGSGCPFCHEDPERAALLDKALEPELSGEGWF